jgi:hypothetical protein
VVGVRLPKMRQNIIIQCTDTAANLDHQKAAWYNCLMYLDGGQLNILRSSAEIGKSGGGGGGWAA